MKKSANIQFSVLCKEMDIWVMMYLYRAKVQIQDISGETKIFLLSH